MEPIVPQSVSRGVKLRKLLGIKLGVLFQHAPRPFRPPNPKAQSGDEVLPTISLVIPSYNQGRFIERSLRSVLDQGYQKLEIVIQDNCSNDETDSVVRSIESEHIKYYSEKDTGQADAINLGFQKTSGEIMCYLNSDDVLLPGVLERIGRFFVANPDIDVIYGNRLIIDATDSVVGEWVLPYHDRELLRHIDYIPQETVFWRRSVWIRAGGMVDEKLAFAMDWDLILRFADANAKFFHMPAFLGGFRVHAEQKTSSQYVSTGLGEMRRLRARYAPGLLGSIFMPVRHALFLLGHIYSNHNASDREEVRP